jgi:hypothetical protein
MHQPNGAATKTPASQGRQDKARGESARRGTRPPAADETAVRAHYWSTLLVRCQNSPEQLLYPLRVLQEISQEPHGRHEKSRMKIRMAHPSFYPTFHPTFLNTSHACGWPLRLPLKLPFTILRLQSVTNLPQSCQDRCAFLDRPVRLVATLQPKNKKKGGKPNGSFSHHSHL